jgi:HSP20 family molecular chaperone IbpA
MRWQISIDWPYPSRSEVERRFEELIRARWPAAETQPPADIFVSQREIRIELDLPGVIESTVQARLARGVLLVEATRSGVAPAERLQAARLERQRGEIRMRVPLPRDIEVGRVEYQLESGVLRVRVHSEEESSAEESSAQES